MGMRQRQVIELYTMKRKITKIPNGHKLNAHGRLARVHRFLWRTLERMGALAQAYDDHEKVIRIPFDADSAFEKIEEGYGNLMEFDRQPFEVLIGPRTLSELMHCRELRDYNYPFTMEAQTERWEQPHRSYPGDPTSRPVRKIFNVPIRVVPQMEGVLVLDR